MIGFFKTRWDFDGELGKSAAMESRPRILELGTHLFSLLSGDCVSSLTASIACSRWFLIQNRFASIEAHKTPRLVLRWKLKNKRRTPVLHTLMRRQRPVPGRGRRRRSRGRPSSPHSAEPPLAEEAFLEERMMTTTTTAAWMIAASRSCGRCCCCCRCYRCYRCCCRPRGRCLHQEDDEHRSRTDRRRTAAEGKEA